MEELLARVSDGIIAFDCNLNFTFANQAAGNLLGRDPSSLSGKNYLDEFPESNGARFVEASLQALRNKKEISINDFYEPRNCWFAYKIFPSDSGLTVFFLPVDGDSEATISLRQSEKHLRTILDNLPVGVAVNSVFPRVEFIYMNKLFPECYCTTPEQLDSPDSFWDAVYEDPAFREEMKKRVLDGLSSGDRAQMQWQEVPITRGGEVKKYITATAIPLPDSNMIVSLVVDETVRVKNYLALRNINEQHRLRLEELIEERTTQLIAANKELEAFSYSVSHDLRAPLRAITGFTKILTDEFAPKLGDEGERICSVITNNSLKMSQLIDDLLHFSRVARKDLSLSKIEMTAMVRAIYHEVTTPEQREKITFLDDKLHDCHGDPNMMRQVWTNLISNAVKFTSKNERPVISIWSDRENEEFKYFIRDNGVGFDMRYKDKLFGVFQRLHGVNEFDGTGVGLALVQRIIYKHGGTVDAESESGKGTTFFFTVPEQIQEKNMMGEKWKTI